MTSAQNQDAAHSSIKIREMRKGDVKRVVDIWLSASILAHDFLEYTFWCCKVPRLLNELSTSTAYILEDKSVVVGFISLAPLEPPNGQAYISELFIDPRYQGRGHGSRLIDHVKKLYTSLILDVYQRDTDTIEKFYGKKHGFQKNGTHVEQETGQSKIKMRWKRLGD